MLPNWLGTHQFSPHSTIDAKTTTDEQRGFKMISTFSYPTFEKLREQNQVFSHLFASASAGRMNVTIGGQDELTDGQFV